MGYYRTCSHCGAHLDPGETCDCTGALKEKVLHLITKLNDEQCVELLRELHERSLLK